MKKLAITFGIWSTIFIAFCLILVFVIYPQDIQYHNQQVLDEFVEVVGEDGEQFLNEYNIIFLDKIPFSDAEADINHFYHQVRIKNDTDAKMLYALIHEYVHYCNKESSEDEVISLTRKIYEGRVSAK